jgi:hypothetical protein
VVRIILSARGQGGGKLVKVELRDATAGDASAVADLFHDTILNVR